MTDKKIFVKLLPFGVVVLDKDKKIKEISLFSKDPKEAINMYLNKGKELLTSTIETYKKQGYIVEEYEGIVDYIDYLIKKKIIGNKEETIDFITDVNRLLAAKEVKREVKWDRYIVNLVDLLEDLTKIINLVYERFVELYGIYYPEAMEKFKGSINDFIKLFDKGIEREKIAKKLKISTESMGIDLSKEDIAVLSSVLEYLKKSIELKRNIEKRIEKIITKHLPNTSAIATPLLTAKLISLAGSLERLVKFPASTIQVLGAEKALFRHLAKGTPSPKHGILYQHPLVFKAKKKERGRIARLLATKIAIALKVDYFSEGKKDIRKELKKDLEKKLKEIREKVKK